MPNEFIRLVAEQVRSDLHGLPGRILRDRASARLARCVTIEDLRRGARRAIPPAPFDFVDGAAADEVTAHRNVDDFDELVLVPRVLRDVADVDLGTTVLGQPVAVPILGAPTGLTGLIHERGEAGVGRAVYGAGSIYILSSMASYAIEELANELPDRLWFQLYMWRDRGLVADLIERARAARCGALVVTVDVPVLGNRERDYRNGFGIPPRLTPRSLGSGLIRPRWSSAFIRRPRITLANARVRGAEYASARTLTGYISQQFDPSVSWADVAWIRERWRGPLIIKGILHAADAADALSAGADGVGVSNHGGRQLDHAVSSIAALPAVVDAVAGRADIFLDGGIRRGTHVIKALALGARAVLAGRALVYGLGAGGERGAVRAMQILVNETRLAMALLGCASVADLNPSWLASHVAPRTSRGASA